MDLELDMEASYLFSSYKMSTVYRHRRVVTISSLECGDDVTNGTGSSGYKSDEAKHENNHILDEFPIIFAKVVGWEFHHRVNDHWKQQRQRHRRKCTYE